MGISLYHLVKNIFPHLNSFGLCVLFQQCKCTVQVPPRVVTPEEWNRAVFSDLLPVGNGPG